MMSLTPFDRTHDHGHGGAGRIDQCRAGLDRLVRRADHLLDLLGRGGAALRQAADFGGHHGEAASLLARPRGLDRRIQGEDVGLEREAVDHAGDVGDSLRRQGDRPHRLDHPPTTSPPRVAATDADCAR